MARSKREDRTMGVRAGIDLVLEPSAAFDEFVEELSAALARLGMRLDPGPGGRVAASPRARLGWGRSSLGVPGGRSCLSGARPTGSRTR